MERCSNCGAAARSGAKFCTTCGYRLQSDYASDTSATDGDTVASDQHETVAAAQPEATAMESESGWPAPPDDAAAIQSIDPDSTATAADDIADPEASDAVAASADQLPSAESTDTASIESAASDVESETGATANPPVASAVATDVSTSDVPGADEVISSSWPPPDATSWNPSWDTSATSSDSLNSSTDAAIDDESSTIETTNDVVETTDDVSATWWSDSPQPIAESAPETELSGDRDPGGSTSTLDEPGAASPFMVTEGESVSVIDDSGDGQPGTDSTARALGLIDELRALLSTLATGSGGEQSTIANDLELALAGDAAITGDQSGLREVLETAREHPRSVDTVLALSGRVEEIIALLDRHDRLARAMEQAITALRPDAASPSRNDEAPDRSERTAI